MCHICKNILNGKINLPEARAKLPRLIDLEQNKRKKEHYNQLYGNMEKAYKRVMNTKKDTIKGWRKNQ